MGYLTPTLAPVTHFLASQFMVCDHWFNPIPTDTHPNRLVSIAGWTPYDTTVGQLADVPRTVLDLLEKHKIEFRVFARRMSFFALVTRWTKESIQGSSRFPPSSQCP